MRFEPVEKFGKDLAATKRTLLIVLVNERIIGSFLP